MSNLFIEFQKLIKHRRPDDGMLVPLLIWASGSENSIEVCQNINKKFFAGNRKIYIDELTLSNSIGHIIRYPKIAKDDEKTKFFNNDICKYFGWTSNELRKNITILNIEELKPVIAKAFGYNDKERRVLKLPKLKNAKKRT